MKEFDICRQRTPEEERAVQQAEMMQYMRRATASAHGLLVEGESIPRYIADELPGMWEMADLIGGETDVA